MYSQEVSNFNKKLRYDKYHILSNRAEVTLLTQI